MDIYEYLEMDHAKLDNLFKLFEKTDSLKRQQELVNLILQEFLVHAYSEQQTFYQELMKFPKTMELGRHGENEHREIEALVFNLSDLTGSSWKEAVITLRGMIEEHVKEEEGTIFSQAKKVISQETAEILKEKMHFLKEKYLHWVKNGDLAILKGQANEFFPDYSKEDKRPGTKHTTH